VPDINDLVQAFTRNKIGNKNRNVRDFS